VTIEIEGADLNGFLGQKVFPLGHWDGFVAELSGEIGDEGPVEDTHKKSKESDGGNGANNDRPFPSDASANGFFGRFNFFLANVDGLDTCELSFELSGSAHEIEGGGARIAEKLEERVGLGRFGKKRFQNGCELARIFMKGSFGGAGVGGRVAEAWGTTGGEGVVVSAKEAGRDRRGFHFPEDGAESRGKAGAGYEIGFFSCKMEVEQRGVGDGFEGDKDAFMGRYRFIQRIDGGVIQTGVVANGFSEMGGASGGHKHLDIAFQLMVARPVESA